MLCDIVVLYVLQKKYFYREKKYQYVEDVESNYFPGYQVVNNYYCAIQRSIYWFLLYSQFAAFQIVPYLRESCSISVILFTLIFIEARTYE